MANNTIINYLVTYNKWDLSTLRLEMRVDCQIQDVNPLVQYNVMISNNTFLNLVSKSKTLIAI